MKCPRCGSDLGFTGVCYGLEDAEFFGPDEWGSLCSLDGMYVRSASCKACSADVTEWVCEEVGLDSARDLMLFLQEQYPDGRDEIARHVAALNLDLNELKVQIRTVENLLQVEGSNVMEHAAAHHVSPEEFQSVDTGLVHLLGFLRDAIEDGQEEPA